MKHNLTTVAALAGLSLLFLCSCSGGSAALSLTQAIEQSSEKIASELPTGSRVAIAAFESSNDSLSDYVMEELADALFDRKIEVANTKNLSSIYRYLNLQKSGELSDGDAQLFGALLGVEFVITGQLRDLGDTYRLTVNAIDVEKAARSSVTRFDVPNDRTMQNMVAALGSQAAAAKTNGNNEQAAPQTAETFIDRGIQSAIRKEFVPAIADFTEAIRLNPNLARAYMLRGRALYAAVSRITSVEADFDNVIIGGSSGKVSAGQTRVYEKAIADFSEAIRLDPKNAKIYSERGRVYGLKEDYDRAIADHDHAIKIEPNYALAYSRRGNAYGNKGDYDRAIADYNQAIKVDPNFAIAYAGRGASYDKKGDYDRAIADYNQAIKIDPNFAIAYYNRGGAYGDKGDYDRAIADLTQAIKIDPNFAIAYAGRGASYDKKGDYDRAIADYNQAIKIDPNFAIAYNNRGVSYKNKGDYDRAIEDYTQAIKLDPNYALAYYNRGTAYDKKGDYDRAIADYTQAIKIDPNNAIAYHNRGASYGKKGDYDRAIADYTQAIKIDPNNAIAYNKRGAAFFRKEDYDRAIADYNQAIKINPNDTGAYIGRGVSYGKKQDYDRAIADYNQAIKIDPNNADAYSYRGATYNNKEDFDRAIADLTQAIKIDPNNADAYSYRGAAYQNKKDSDRAIADYTQAIKINPNNSLAKENIERIRQGQTANVAGSPSSAIDQLGQTTMNTLEKEPWKEGLYRAMGINPRTGPMPPLSPAEQRCKAMIDRQKRDCAYSESGPCSPGAVQRDVAACVDDLRREWLSRR